MAKRSDWRVSKIHPDKVRSGDYYALSGGRTAVVMDARSYVDADGEIRTVLVIERVSGRQMVRVLSSSEGDMVFISQNTKRRRARSNYSNIVTLENSSSLVS